MRIGIDFDEVVADSIKAIISLHNEQYGTNFKKEDVTEYKFENVWGGTLDEWRDKLNDFFSTKHLVRLDPMAGSMLGLRAMKERGHELYIVTGRSRVVDLDATELWLKMHFPDVFHGVHYANFLAQDPTTARRKKSEICLENRIGVLVDDHIGTALECAEAGVKVLLFNQPWNQGELLPGITRVFSWDDVVREVG